MSKLLKNAITEQFKKRLNGVQDAILANISALDANKNNRLRMQLAKKNIHVLVVRNSLARRATEGTPLAPAFQSLEGSTAVVWGSEDIVSLAKEFSTLTGAKEFEGIVSGGGVMDGQKLSAEEVKAVSKWPSRQEMLSIISGQLLAPGAKLSAQLLGAGSMLASQIKQKGEGEEGEAGEAAASEPAAE